jgi:hypothetical protein
MSIATTLKRAAQVATFGAALVLTPHVSTTTLKNPLVECISMAAGKEAQAVNVDEVYNDVKKLFLTGESEKEKDLNSLAKTLIGLKRDRFNEIVNRLKNYDKLYPIIDAYKKAIGTEQLEQPEEVAKLFGVIENVHKEIKKCKENTNCKDLNALREKYDGKFDEFVDMILIKAYFERGKFKEFFAAMKNTNNYRPFKKIFNEIVKNEKGVSAKLFRTQLEMWGNTYAQLLNGINDEKGKPDKETDNAILALNAFFEIKNKDNNKVEKDLTLETIRNLGRMKGINEETEIGEVKPQKEYVKRPRAEKGYEDDIISWIKEKGYVIIDLGGLIQYVTNKLEKEKVDNLKTWLDSELTTGNLKNYIIKKESSYDTTKQVETLLPFDRQNNK